MPDSKTVIGTPQSVQMFPVIPSSVDALVNEREGLAAAVEDRPSALVKLGGAMKGATTGRAVSAVREMLSGVRGEHDAEADYTYEPPKEFLVGQSADRQAERLTARSTRELNYIMDGQAEEDERMKVLSSNGFWSGMGWAAAGEMADMTNWLAPMAATRLMGMKSALAAAEGRKAATLGYATAENMLAGTAIEGTLQVLEQRPDPANFALAATVDLGVSFAQTASLLHSAKAFQAAQDAATREIDTFERAAANVGPGARPEQIEAEYQRIRFEEIREPIAASIAPVPHRAKLMEHPDEVADGEDDLFKAVDAEPVAAEAAVPEQGTVPEPVAPKPAGKLPAELSKAAPRFNYGNKQFTLEFESDVDRALFIVAQDKPSKRDADFLRFAMQELGLDTSDIPTLRTKGKAIRAELKEMAKNSEPGVLRYTKEQSLMPGPMPDAPASRAPAKAVPVRKAIEAALNSPALQVVNETSRATRHLLTHLQKTLPAHVLDNVPVKFEGDVRGNYNPIDNDISAPGKSASELQDVGYGNRNDANILAHEVVHAATGRLIAAVRDNVPGVSAGAKAAVQRLEEIRLELDAHLRAKGIRQPARKAGADYAAGDLDEFVAQVMSDVETRKALTELPAKGFKDLLSAFADAVMRLLGLDPKTNNSALKEAVALIDKIIREGEIVKGANAGNYIKTKPGLRAPMPNTPTSRQTPAQSVNAFSTDPIAIKYGLTGLPVATTAERAKAKAILNLYKKAGTWAVAHPKDDAWNKRAQNLIDNSVFSAASTGLTMLKSENPVARMIAAELLEDASNVKGYVGNTAAVSKYMHERLFLGNAINDVQNAYAVWRKRAGGSLKDDAFGGEYKARFDREVAIEIEARRNMRPLNPGTDPNVKAAADSLEKAYERIRRAQIDNKTLGWAALPKSSVGYMPHKISPGKWRTLSNEKRQVVHDALVEQFVTIEGWDISFSDQLASRYLQRVQARANGGHDAPIGGASAGSAEIVEDALLSLGMSADEVRKNMQKFNRGAAGWTKGRLDLDLNRVYDVNGEQFKLLDIFETDQIELLRSQAGRASGEVALARKGIYGRPGLEIIRESLTYGEAAGRGTDQVLGAFDQVAAEFMNAPFGNAGPKWMERARILNSVVRLGGIVFNQFAEFANAITHLGVARTLSAIGDMPRLRREIKDLAAGKRVDNPLLTSSELLGGAEFGTDAYKIVLPFDNHDAAYPVYGVDTVSAADRLLRGMSYAQGKLSMWRAVHSMQQRGIAEQVVAKMARYSRDGIEDAALTGFGITPEMRRAIIDDGVARWDAQGSLLEFDVTKFADQAMAEDVVQAIHRGTSQIIQGTFIGETGKWAHDGYLKVLTQFRTFSLTAMEKQWGRQRNSHGTFKTLGLLLGSMSVVLPVYVARVYASSIGREDQEEFLDKRLAPEMIARQLLNYVAISNVAGEFIDMGATLLVPDEYGVKMTGGRAGTDTEFVGNMVAPSLSLVDDVWTAFQNLNDSEKIMRVIPGSRLPGAVPAINYLNEALSDFAD